MKKNKEEGYEMEIKKIRLGKRWNDEDMINVAVFFIGAFTGSIMTVLRVNTFHHFDVAYSMLASLLINVIAFALSLAIMSMTYIKYKKVVYFKRVRNEK
jgi:hypothetical protein